jgi:hypothetical protein
MALHGRAPLLLLLLLPAAADPTAPVPTAVALRERRVHSSVADVPTRISVSANCTLVERFA